MSLKELVFSDLCVADTATASWYKATPDALATQTIPRECEAELAQLHQRLVSHKGGSDFKVDWPDENGLRMRVGRIDVSDSKTVFVCRRYRLMPSAHLSDLGMPKQVAQKLLAPDLTEGLVVLLGKTGSGKTTTAACFIGERLSTYGGVCWTIENPIELRMQGRYGAGVCYQTEVQSDEELEAIAGRLYRATPNIVMIGEIRTSRAVRVAISFATSGHLVVTTLHASDLSAGLARLARMAGDDKASVALSDALRVGIHLELHNAENKPAPGTVLTDPEAKGTGTPPRVLGVEPLWVSGHATEGLKAILRDGDFHLLKSEIERQRRGFMMNKLP